MVFVHNHFVGTYTTCFEINYKKYPSTLCLILNQPLDMFWYVEDVSFFQF